MLTSSAICPATPALVFPCFSPRDVPQPPRREPLPGPLGAALRTNIEHRWHGLRTAKRSACQAAIGVRTLQAIAGPDVAPEAVTKAIVQEAVSQWREAGTSAATIVARLNCLSALGVGVKGCRPRVPRKLKWWLDAEGEEKIVATLVGSERSKLRGSSNGPPAPAFASRRACASPGATSAKAPGAQLLRCRGQRQAPRKRPLYCRRTPSRCLKPGSVGSPGELVFNLTYCECQRIWLQYRRVFGLKDPKAATLKALRRVAARNLHAVKGMPLDLVRQYLRHESVSTTLSYLRLTGGYSEDEMAKWL